MTALAPTILPAARIQANPILHWIEGDVAQQARWQCANGMPMPKKVLVIDDSISADSAYRLACEGTGLLWRGDFQNARLLLQALARRIERAKQRKAEIVQARASKKNRATDNHATRAASPFTLPTNTPIAPPLGSPMMALAFHQHRQQQAQRARVLGMLLIPVAENLVIPLRRAPEVQAALGEVFADQRQPFVISLRELQGLIGAHEWRKNGVPIAALGAAIHPHYGVFSPVRGEYIELVAKAPLPAALKDYPAFEIGTGSGVLAAILAKRGVQKILATELYPQAVACAKNNLQRLGYSPQVQVLQVDLFPDAAAGLAGLIVCNPPWLPIRPNGMLEQAIYDPDSKMLRGFLQGLAARLAPGGEGWLILSDIAEQLGLRTRADLQEWINAAGLKVQAKHDLKPQHPKTRDIRDPLQQVRAAETTSLWRLVANLVNTD